VGIFDTNLGNNGAPLKIKFAWSVRKAGIRGLNRASG